MRFQIAVVKVQRTRYPWNELAAASLQQQAKPNRNFHRRPKRRQPRHHAFTISCMRGELLASLGFVLVFDGNDMDDDDNSPEVTSSTLSYKLARSV